MATIYEQLSDAEKQKRRELERLSLLGPFARFQEQFKGMFDVDEPTMKQGDYPIPLDDWAYNPANQVSSLLDTAKNPRDPIPDWAKPSQLQKFNINPTYGRGDGEFIGRGTFKEYNPDGTPDTTLLGFKQETETYDLMYNQLTPDAKLKADKMKTELNNYRKDNSPGANPFSKEAEDFYKGQKAILNKYEFTPLDVAPEYREQFGLSRDGKTNLDYGGPLRMGTPVANLDDTIPSVAAGTPYGDKSGRVSQGSALKGKTLRKTIEDAGMVMKNNNVAVPLASSLQYSGDNVPFSSPAIQSATEGFNTTPEAYGIFMDLYGPKAVEETAKTSFANIAPYIGPALTLYGLLSQPPAIPAASAPSGVSGAKLNLPNLYDRERYQYGNLLG